MQLFDFQTQSTPVAKVVYVFFAWAFDLESVYPFMQTAAAAAAAPNLNYCCLLAWGACWLLACWTTNRQLHPPHSNLTEHFTI